MMDDITTKKSRDPSPNVASKRPTGQLVKKSKQKAQASGSGWNDLFTELHVLGSSSQKNCGVGHTIIAKRASDITESKPKTQERQKSHSIANIDEHGGNIKKKHKVRRTDTVKRALDVEASASKVPRKKRYSCTTMDSCNTKTKQKCWRSLPQSATCNVNGITDDSFTKDLVSHGLQKGDVQLELRGTGAGLGKSNNMMRCLSDLTMGIKSQIQVRKCVGSCISRRVSDLALYRTTKLSSLGHSKLTALQWHPTRPHLLAVGTARGSFTIWDTAHTHTDTFIDELQGRYNGSCNTIKFLPWDDNKVLLAVVCRDVLVYDITTHSKCVLEASGHSSSYCTSADVNQNHRMFGVGRHDGSVRLLSRRGTTIFEGSLHKDIVTHVEFCPLNSWLLCTTSLDKTVKMWDVRKIENKNSFLHSLPHYEKVSSVYGGPVYDILKAYFSPTNPHRLLTTDQFSRIRVYQYPDWTEERAIQSSLNYSTAASAIKAVWHPLHDLIVCGRYSPEKKKIVNVFDADTGDMICELQDPKVTGICALNVFNRDGTVLASATGQKVCLWKSKLIEGLASGRAKPGRKRRTCTPKS